MFSRTRRIQVSVGGLALAVLGLVARESRGTATTFDYAFFWIIGGIHVGIILWIFFVEATE